MSYSHQHLQEAAQIISQLDPETCERAVRLLGDVRARGGGHRVDKTAMANCAVPAFGASARLIVGEGLLSLGKVTNVLPAAYGLGME